MFKTIFLITLMLLTSCTSKIKQGIKDAKYSAYEMVGYEKRDLFKKEIKTVKKEQEGTQEAFEDALKKLQYFYSYDGGKTESEYNRLKNAYDRSRDESLTLSSSIKQLDDIAQDLFLEWQKEIKAISSAELRLKSTDKLTETKLKYATLFKKLKQSEKKMTPLLTKINDQVLFLKHNLNAGAIAGLQSEGERIEKDIEKLIEEMKISNKEAEEFINTL